MLQDSQIMRDGRSVLITRATGRDDWIDEGCSSARMSRYEIGVHEPPFLVIESIAHFLKVPVAYFFCDDDRLAEIMRIYSSENAACFRDVYATWSGE